MKSKSITAEAVLRGLEKRKFKSREETWTEWLEKVSQCESAEELKALIHRGFSAQTKTIEQDIERLEFYFSLAARWHSQLEGFDKLVYTTLCSNFLLPFVRDQGLRLGFKENIYSQPRVVMLVSKFYTPERINMIQGIPLLGGKYAWESTSIFLEKFASWHALWHRQERLSDDIYLWAIYTLYRMGKLNALYGHQYFECITEQCLDKIKNMAITDSKSGVTIDKACTEMRPIAQFYILALDFSRRLDSSC